MDIYRVVCSENQKLYPGETFIDFMPAGLNRSENSFIHDSILKMRRTINPEVDSLTNGLLLYDFGAGRVQVHYEKAYNHIIRRNQEYIRSKYEQMIIRRFNEMREAGKDRTIDINMTNLAIMYDFYKKPAPEEDASPVSGIEMELRRKAEEYRQQQKRRKEMLAVKNEQAKRQEQENLSSEQLLAWKMAHYQGD